MLQHRQTAVRRWAQDSEHRPDHWWQLRDGLCRLVLRSLGRRLARPQVVILKRLAKRALDTLGRAGRSKKWHRVAAFRPLFERLYTGVNRRRRSATKGSSKALGVTTGERGINVSLRALLPFLSTYGVYRIKPNAGQGLRRATDSSLSVGKRYDQKRFRNRAIRGVMRDSESRGGC
jgi:hypothetical protein